MNKQLFTVLLASFLAITGITTHAQQSSDNTTLDQIVAVVNDHVILKSEVNQRVQEYLYQMQQQGQRNIQFSEDIWYAVLQDMVQNKVLLDQAKVDSITVTEEQVDQRINRRIDQTVQQMGSEEALEQQMGKSIVQIRSDLREQYRQDIIIQQYRQQKRQSIQITRPEVEEFFNSIPEDSLPTIPEQVALSQIVKIPAAGEDARADARQLAEQLRDSLINHGKNIEDLARRYSDGPSASNGGRISMYPLDELVAEYSAAAAALQPGEISEVVETSFGFHVIRLNERQGDQIDTNHILIEIDEEKYDDETAINRLAELRDSIQTNDVSFASVARNQSEDPNTAPQGGRILDSQSGSRLQPLEQLPTDLYRIALLLEDEGDISEPKPFTVGTGNNTKKAFRIVRMDEHIPEHTANLEDDYNAIKQRALQEKQYGIIQNWINELKKDVYIEYKIPMPDRFEDENLNYSSRQ